LRLFLSPDGRNAAGFSDFPKSPQESSVGSNNHSKPLRTIRGHKVTSKQRPIMKTKLAFLRPAALALFLLVMMNHPLSTFAQGTAFTYQGRLNASGQPANGVYDLRFRLSSDALGNNYVGAISC